MADSDLLEIVPTRAQLLKSNKTQFNATVFESHQKKVKSDQPAAAWKKTFNNKRNSDSDDEDDEAGTQRRLPKRKRVDDTEFDIKRARNEVINLAMSSGFNKEKNKKKAEIAMLVKLGAKPPPRPYRNYKQLLKEKAHTKNQQEKQEKFAKLGKNQCGAATVKCRKNMKTKRKQIVVGGISKNYGVVKPNLKKK